MPQVFTAFASEVKVNDETLEGLQSIEYSITKSRQHVGAIGSDERIAVYFGMKSGFIPEDQAPDELIAGTERGGAMVPSESAK